MTRCPTCNRVETDETLKFCRADGATLISDTSSFSNEAGTARLGSGQVSSEIKTSVLPDRPESNISRAIAPTTVLAHPELQQTTRQLSKFNRRKIAFLALIAAVVVIASIVAGYFYLRTTTRVIDSIAVLPFENRSGSADADYLSDGLADSLIYRLSQLPNLKVSPTSSVMRYKGKDTDVSQVAKELEVDAIMSGRLVQQGDGLSISVQLIDSRTKKLIWAEQYDRKMADLLSTQREIATTIAQKLQLKLAGTEAKGITKKYTDSNEAYQLYLKGRYHFAKRTKDDVLKSIEYYQQAIKLDPTFALAYARIAEAYNQMPAYPYLSPKEAIPQAKTAATRALQIDPTLAEAHTALANSLAVYDWNWAEAELEFKRAIELDSNSSAAHFRYGQACLVPLGRSDEAVAEIKRGLELEPLDLNMEANLAWAYMFAGKYNQALDEINKTYALEPNFVLGSVVLGQIYNASEKYSEAIALTEGSLQTDPTSQFMLQISGYAYAMSGRRHEAEEIIKRFQEIEKNQYAMSYYVATIYAALGEKDKAFSELEKAFEAHDWDLHRLKVDPAVAPLRDDPRFKDLLHRIGLE